MSRSLLLRRLVPFSPTAAGSSSCTSQRVSSAPSRYAAAAQADAAAAGQAGAAQAGAAAAGDGEQGASAPPHEARGQRGLVKFGALAAVSAALGGVGYVSYGEDPPLPSRSRPQGGSLCLDSSVWGGCSSDFFCCFVPRLAYSLDEVEQNTREFRKKQAATLPDYASEFEVKWQLPQPYCCLLVFASIESPLGSCCKLVM
jgi:hypothetical protein